MKALHNSVRFIKTTALDQPSRAKGQEEHSNADN
jgi:hypothetical protein